MNIRLSHIMIVIPILICGTLLLFGRAPGNKTNETDSARHYAVAPVLEAKTPQVAPKPQTVQRHTSKDTRPEETDVNIEQQTFDSVEAYNAVSEYGPLPDYLSDVGFDGGLNLDQQGNLLVSHDVRRLFDFFLAAVRIEGMDLCSDRINEYIDLTLPPDAAVQARSVWQSYRTYKERMKDLYDDFSQSWEVASKDDMLDLFESTVEKRKSLRRECMTEDVVQAFFSDEEEDDAQTLFMMRAHQALNGSPEKTPNS